MKSKSPQSMDRHGNYVQKLKALSSLLEEQGYHAHSRLILDYAEQLLGGASPSILATHDLWGGSGSVVDSTISPGLSASAADGGDGHRFCLLLVELADLMIEDGVATSIVESRRETFAIWGGVDSGEG